MNCLFQSSAWNVVELSKSLRRFRLNFKVVRILEFQITKDIDEVNEQLRKLS